MRNFRKIIGSAGALAIIAVAFGVQAGFSAAPSAPSSVVTVDPARILDTRIALGVPGSTPVGPASTITVQVTGVGGVPANATGVVVTITGTEATQNTFVTATPTGSPRSTTSVLNVSPGVDIANTITVALGTNGQIDLYNNGGKVHLIADVTGYLLPATGTSTTTPHVETTTVEFNAFSGTGINLGAPTFSDGCVNLGTNGELYLDLPLPHGAAVSKVDFRYFDNDIANATFALIEVDQQPFAAPSPGPTLGNSQTQSTGQVGYGVASITPTGADQVSATVRYQILALSLGISQPGNLEKFCGASVEYKMLVP
jgi:hypothetical protein